MVIERIARDREKLVYWVIESIHLMLMSSENWGRHTIFIEDSPRLGMNVGAPV
jgi:hypothetical protein